MQPKISKREINSLEMKDKVKVGKDIESIMAREKDKLNQDTQILRDRIDIQDAVDNEKSFFKKMQTLKQALRECPTIRQSEFK